MDTLKLRLLTYPSVFVIYDRNVQDFALKIAGNKPSFALDATEKNKTIETVIQIQRWLLDRGATRKSLILAIGGGITSDIAGFAASIYKRGIRYAIIPTTLLSQVDASIGGKTAVNLDNIKNAIGSFREPEFVHLNADILRSLPSEQLKAGYAELLKTFIIADPLGYERAVHLISEGASIENLVPLIKQAAKIKTKITKKDPLEKGKRMVLNLGHSYGHAIEWWQQRSGVQSPYSHGEAVAIGIVMAAQKSEERGFAKSGLAAKIKADFQFCGLPTEPPCMEEDLQEALKADKKDGNFVFIRRIGSVVVRKI